MKLIKNPLLHDVAMLDVQLWTRFSNMKFETIWTKLTEWSGPYQLFGFLREIKMLRENFEEKSEQCLSVRKADMDQFHLVNLDHFDPKFMHSVAFAWKKEFIAHSIYLFMIEKHHYIQYMPKSIRKMRYEKVYLFIAWKWVVMQELTVHLYMQATCVRRRVKINDWWWAKSYSIVVLQRMRMRSNVLYKLRTR